MVSMSSSDVRYGDTSVVFYRIKTDRVKNRIESRAAVLAEAAAK